jgi:hypothetical protein
LQGRDQKREDQKRLICAPTTEGMKVLPVETHSLLGIEDGNGILS